MTPTRFMVIAGEPSGDMLAAELVGELRAGLQRQSTYSPNVQPLSSDLAPRFFGAGGPRLAAAGVELAFDLTTHSVIGLSAVLRHYFEFKRLFDQLVALAIEREPHVIICVDFSGFNRRFAAAIKKYVRARRGTFNNWEPKIIQYISPQVWASRPGRSFQIARDFDLLLTIFPFEKPWYAERFPRLNVEFVGHPMMDRYQNLARPTKSIEPLIALLPGSRKSELTSHFPVMLEAFAKIRAAIPSARAIVVQPSENMADAARQRVPASLQNSVTIQVGRLSDALSQATLALACTGTVTMECAYFGLPAVTLYKTSWLTYQIAKQVINVKSLTMPNLLAGEPVYPEFIQHDATAENISQAGLELLHDLSRPEHVRLRLAEIIATLGAPGATRRAADAILKLLITH